MSSRIVMRSVLIFVAVALLAGCEKKPELTYAGWGTIEGGMTPMLVEETIGPPRYKGPEFWEYEDVELQISGRLYFDYDGTEVVCKRWYDPAHGWVSDASFPGADDDDPAEP